MTLYTCSAFLQSEPANEMTMEDYIEEERLLNIKNKKQDEITDLIMLLYKKNSINNNDLDYSKFIVPHSYHRTLDNITHETSMETITAIKESARYCVTQIIDPNTKSKDIIIWERILRCVTFAIKKHTK